MSTKNFLSIYAVVILLYGLLFLFLPGTAYDLYGISDQSSDLSTNLLQGLGSVFIPAGIMSWLARDASASHGRKGILVFIALSSLIFLIRNLMGVFAGVTFGAMTYVDLIVQALFAGGGFYLLRNEKGS